MSTPPPGPTPRMPESSAGSAAEGIGFAFHDGGRRIGLRHGHGSRERIYVDGEIVADEARSGLASTHSFAVDGVRYSLRQRGR